MMKKKILALCLLFALALSGCGNAQEENPSDSAVSALASTTYAPMQQPDGSKLRIGLVGVFEYEPAAVYIYNVVEALREDGWIACDSLPFTETNTDVKTMIQRLAEMDLGPYIEFDGEAAYYLEDEDEAAIAESLQERVDDGLDVVLAMGTDPGLFMKEQDLDVITIDCMATDPVASGIVASSTDSGDAQMWAQIEPSPYVRQLKYYHSILPFEHIAMVYTDPIIAGIPDYEKAAADLGVTMTTREVDEETAADEEKLAAVYDELLAQDIDALMLCAGLVTSEMDAAALLEPFIAAGIPVFVQDGENYVEAGALLLVASTDNAGVGRFVAETVEQIARGTDVSEIPMEYVSSPYISLNLETAERIGFQPDFDLLLACETVYPKRTTEGDRDE